MYYHILTNCGKTITRKVKRLDESSQQHMRHAMIGAAIEDESGNLLDVKDVIFSEEKTAPTCPPAGYTIHDCACPDCGEPSAGFTDAQGSVPLKCFKCTTKTPSA